MIRFSLRQHKDSPAALFPPSSLLILLVAPNPLRFVRVHTLSRSLRSDLPCIVLSNPLRWHWVRFDFFKRKIRCDDITHKNYGSQLSQMPPPSIDVAIDAPDSARISYSDSLRSEEKGIENKRKPFFWDI